MKYIATIPAAMMAAACIFLAGCHPSAPRADYGSCVRGHVVNDVIMVPFYGANGTVSYTLMPTTRYICDEYQYPTGDGPEYHDDVKRYEAEMVEWRKKHPNED